MAQSWFVMQALAFLCVAITSAERAGESSAKIVLQEDKPPSSESVEQQGMGLQASEWMDSKYGRAKEGHGNKEEVSIQVVRNGAFQVGLEQEVHVDHVESFTELQSHTSDSFGFNEDYLKRACKFISHSFEEALKDSLGEWEGEWQETSKEAYDNEKNRVVKLAIKPAFGKPIASEANARLSMRGLVPAYLCAFGSEIKDVPDFKQTTLHQQKLMVWKIAAKLLPKNVDCSEADGMTCKDSEQGTKVVETNTIVSLYFGHQALQYACAPLLCQSIRGVGDLFTTDCQTNLRKGVYDETNFKSERLALLNGVLNSVAVDTKPRSGAHLPIEQATEAWASVGKTLTMGEVDPDKILDFPKTGEEDFVVKLKLVQKIACKVEPKVECGCEKMVE